MPSFARPAGSHEIRTGEIPPYPVIHSPVYHLAGRGRYLATPPPYEAPTHSQTSTNTSQSPFVDLSAQAVPPSTKPLSPLGYGDMRLLFRSVHVDYERQVLDPQAPSSAMLDREIEPSVLTSPYGRNSNVNNPVAPTSTHTIPAPMSNLMTYPQNQVMSGPSSDINDHEFQIKGAAQQSRMRNARRRVAQRVKKAAARASDPKPDNTNNAGRNNPAKGKKAKNQANEVLSPTRHYNLRSRKTGSN